MRDPRYDILFEPVQIGPVTAKNRFYQVPHCNGLGHAFPSGEAAMRGMKAEGGWAVVSNQETEIHPSSDAAPFVEARLWDEGDMERLQLSVNAIHEHGALAAIELGYYAHSAHNGHSRLPIMAVSDMIIDSYDPTQTYAMTKRDIANVRRWHRKAAIRARDIGYDIVYVYAGHDLALAFHCLSPKFNSRTDEYGGSLENRARLLRELLEDTHEAVGDTCGIALRIAMDELLGDLGLVSETEGKELVEMLADHPDLWDVNISNWSNDSQTSRFSEEGFQEKYTAFVKQVTSKPVVGVGRFTSPDTMVSQIKRGVLDMIGAARPSIADPFLPKKIEQGRMDDIRECIGCNICVASDMTIVPIRCTQNPTSGEEFRRGWHPETMQKSKSNDAILIIGGGPSGLEAALSLGRRGYRVTLAESGDQPGGRAWSESLLPGLSAWKRVADYRMGQIDKLDNIAVFLQSELNKEQVLEFARELDVQHVLCTTGSSWDKDGIGRQHRHTIPRESDVRVYTPDDVMAGVQLSGQVLVYDDDHYYMGGVVAEALVKQGAAVTLVTPAPDVSLWTRNTLEQGYIERHLHELGVDIIEKHRLEFISSSGVTLSHISSQKSREISVDSVIMVTARRARNELYFALQSDQESLNHAGLKSVSRAGDCVAPSTIANAVYHGHRFAREFDENVDVDSIPFKREYVEI